MAHRANRVAAIVLLAGATVRAQQAPRTQSEVARPGGKIAGAPPLALVKIADGFNDPTNVASANDGSGRLFVVERVGRVKIVDKDGKQLPHYGWNKMEASYCHPMTGAPDPNCPVVGVLPAAEYPHEQAYPGAPPKPDGSGCSVEGLGIANYAGMRSVYFSGDWCTGRLFGLAWDGSKWQFEEMLHTNLQFTAGGNGEDGYVYAVNCNCFYTADRGPMGNPPGALWKIVPASEVKPGQDTALTVQQITEAARLTAGAPQFRGALNNSPITLNKYPPITETGEHTYEMIHDWGQLPSSIKYGNTRSVVEDSHGFIYVHHTVHPTSQSGDAIVVFDDKGKFVRSFGSMFRNGAHGMHVQKEGTDEYLYFCDEKHGIVTKRTLKGEEIWTRGYPQESAPYEKGPGKPGLNYRPTNIAIAPNGDFWVSDGYGSYFVHHYDKNAKLLNTFGGPPPGPPGAGRGAPGRGDGRGDAATPGGAPMPAAAPGADAPGSAATGAPPAAGGAGGQGRGRGTGPVPAPIENLNNPHGVWLDTRDAAKPMLLVADRGNRRIVRYTLDDKPVDIVEGTLAPCAFHTRNGVMVVPDLQSRVTLYDQSNKVITYLGDGAYAGRQNQLRVATDRSQFEPGKFITPHGAWFDHAGNIFVGEWVEIGRVTKLRKV